MTAPLILGTNSIKDEGYEVANSLRFNDDSSDYLSRTPSSAGNRRTFTISVWIKRGNLSSQDHIASGSGTEIRFTPADKTMFRDGGGNYGLSDAVFRDVSAWYHFVYAIDTTQATESNRIKLYVNGEQFTVTTFPTQNFDFNWNNNVEHQIGASGGAEFFDGYMAEFVHIDGQQLNSTSFGEFDEDTGIWKPIDVSGLTFGTNGFYLDFENSGSLGADVSGNGNNFSVNNLTSIDQVSDSPTNNFATMNPLANQGTVTFSDGNLSTNQSNNSANASGTIFANIGKWYWECKSTDANTNLAFGIMRDDTQYNNSDIYQVVGTIMYYKGNGEIFDNIPTTSGGVSTAYGDSWGNGDIVSCAIDLDNGYLYFAKNGTWQNSGDPTSGATGTGGISIPTGEFFTAVLGNGSGSTSASSSMNFGNPPYSISSGNSDANGYGNFEYAVPSGYYALNTKNLAEYG
jgi:hypothetical protein